MARLPLALISSLGLAVTGLCVGTASMSAHAGSFDLGIAGANVSIEVQSYRDRQYSRIIQQKYDYSCGSAALATLLTFHYDQDQTEETIYKAMWDVGNQANIRKIGFSLFDMRLYLKSRNMLADGFKMTLDRVSEIGVPGIALITVNGYKHFVVIKGIRNDRILIGDPSGGLMVQSKAEFTKVWDGTIFFIRSDLDKGLASFNLDVDWSAHPEGNLALAQNLSSLQRETLHTTRVLNSGFSILTAVPGQ